MSLRGELADHMPHFVWMLRDFSLQLTDRQGRRIDGAQYLEEALAPREGGARDREAVRSHVRSAFRERSLFTLPRPAPDELLSKLGGAPGRTNPAFNARVNELQTFVHARIKR